MLLSDAGLESALAGRHWLALSVPVSHIHGGMQAWIATAMKADGRTLSALENTAISRIDGGLSIIGCQRSIYGSKWVQGKVTLVQFQP